MDYTIALYTHSYKNHRKRIVALDYPVPRRLLNWEIEK